MMDRLWGAFGDKLWTLTRENLPLGTWGLTKYEDKTVVVADGLTEAEATCTLAHELEHVRRGPPPPGWEAQEENRVSRIAARRLLPDLVAVAKAVEYAGWQLDEAAEELEVDVDTLQWRLRTLHPGELRFMEMWFEEREADVG